MHPTRQPALRSLVVTADDFGLAREVNEGIEIAHRNGILSAASLMVAGRAAQDAVARAVRMPRLKVGLHLVMIEGEPVLRRDAIPDLVGPDGRFRSDLAKLGTAIFLRPSVKRQVAAEIAAQFEAYRATGLPLDHVDAHKHYHLHPTIAGLLIRIGRRYGMRALRVPVEPASILARVEPVRQGLEARLAATFAKLLRGRVRRAGIATADSVLGLAWSGAMTTPRIAGLLAHLPPGRTELYTHPAISDAFADHAPGYRYADELAALTAPEVVAAARRPGLALSSYGEWAEAP